MVQDDEDRKDHRPLWGSKDNWRLLPRSCRQVAEPAPTTRDVKDKGERTASCHGWTKNKAALADRFPKGNRHTESKKGCKSRLFGCGAVGFGCDYFSEFSFRTYISLPQPFHLLWKACTFLLWTSKPLSKSFAASRLDTESQSFGKSSARTGRDNNRRTTFLDAKGKQKSFFLRTQTHQQELYCGLFGCGSREPTLHCWSKSEAYFDIGFCKRCLSCLHKNEIRRAFGHKQHQRPQRSNNRLEHSNKRCRCSDNFFWRKSSQSSYRQKRQGSIQTNSYQRHRALYRNKQPIYRLCRFFGLFNFFKRRFISANRRFAAARQPFAKANFVPRTDKRRLWFFKALFLHNQERKRQNDCAA